MNRKILISLSVIGLVAAIAIGGTVAFFSDTETSTGNTFTAGDLDLTIDSACTYNDDIISDCTWEDFKNLNGELFFNFADIKPGDSGEDTISLHVTNDSWACMTFAVTENAENGCNEPEIAAEPACGDDEIGELLGNLNFTVWRDTDCDNVFDAEETEITAIGDIYPVADSGHGTPLLASAAETCVGIKWNVPSSVGNEIQSDRVMASLTFYAEQSRNNPNFLCNPPQLEVTIGDGFCPEFSNWLAKARHGGAGGYRAELGKGPGARDEWYTGGTVPYTSGNTYPFTLVDDGAGKATFTIAGNTLDTTGYTTVNSDGRVCINAKMSGKVGTVAVDNVVLNGMSAGSVSATDVNKYMLIEGGTLDDGFTLTGDMTFTWSSSSDERPSMIIFVEED